jgi:hypothetical protein
LNDPLLIIQFAMEGQGTDPAAGGAPGQGARPSNKRLQQTQAQVDEVVGIMKVSFYFKQKAV